MTTLVGDDEVDTIYNIFIHGADDNEYNYPHVDNIDGIDVEVQIVYMKGHVTKLYYKIRSNFYENYDGNKDRDGDDRVTLFESKITYLPERQILSKCHIQHILIDIENQASKLIFNKRQGVFMTYRRDVTKNHNTTVVCCVCNQLTKIQTQCKHHLCLGCSQKLTSERKCPICRACNIFLLEKRQ